MNLRTTQRSISVWIFVACAAWLIGLGAYFAILRPPLLPEDPRYIGADLAEIRHALPGLERWLRRVFLVMGGFMATTGVLTAFHAATAVSERRRGTGWVMALAGLFTVFLMSAVNFAIDSDFKWLLLAPALLWFGGLVSYALNR